MNSSGNWNLRTKVFGASTIAGKRQVRFEKTTNCVKISPPMSDGAIITVENLGKRYSLRHLRDQRYVALRDVLVEKATGLFRRNGRRSKNAPPTSSSHLLS